MSDNKKVVVLAIDAGSKDLLLQWAHDGTLPTLHALLSKSLTGVTMSTPGFFVGSTWASWFTGVNPGKHGYYSRKQLKPGTYESYFTNPGEEKREPFWNYLSRAGRKVAILDIPLTSLSQNLNGIQTVEYGSHDAHYGFQTRPQQLATEVKKRFGPPCSHPPKGDCDAERDSSGVSTFRDDLIQGIKRKTELTKHLLHKDNWDFFAQVFTESHCIGHQCWHIHDSTQHMHDAELSKSLGDPIKDVYKAIDTGLGEILKEIDDETTVIIYVSHGMGKSNVPYNFMQKLLHHLRLTEQASINTKNITGNLITRVRKFLQVTWHKTPSKIQEYLVPIKDIVSQKMYHARPDWASSKCFAIHDNPSHSGIRVNLVGREPEGKVRPGADYEQFCEKLENDLLGIINVGTGKPIVQRVIRTADYYFGEYLDHLPDLLVEWDEEDHIPAIYSKKFGKIPISLSHPRTGHHRAEGMFLAFGPSIQPGTLNRTVSIMDFAPTIAQLLNVSLPDVDGQPISELLRPSS
jgi:predicted AlkP superfamily phosphohydrolase/phosphomutase